MNPNQIYKLLLNHYGKQGWWPINEKYRKTYKKPTKAEQYEIAVGAILTQNTSWNNVNKALSNLRKSSLLTKSAIKNIPINALAKQIKPSGYYNQKAKKLKHFTSSKNPTTRKELLSIWGIGKETADSILLYAHQKPIFVIDAYTRRIFRRLGIEKDYDQLQDYFHKSLPKDYKLYNEYHALLVKHAKEHCKSKPECKNCPIKKHCNRFKLAESINRSEEEIKKGKFVKADTSMADEEIDEILMK